jgi:ABC-type antimicrobial peptide transport system permease subunit
LARWRPFSAAWPFLFPAWGCWVYRHLWQNGEKKEIGIRKVLGASTAGITTLLSKDFLQLVIIACLIAFPLSWWIMHNWLQNYEYRIKINWWIFLAAGISAILIALFTISFQSVKAAIANPVKSLRTE